MSVPNVLTPALAKMVPPGTQVLCTVVVRVLQLPNGQQGVNAEYPAGMELAAVRALARGVDTVLNQMQAAAAKAAPPPVETPTPDLVARLLQRRNGSQ